MTRDELEKIRKDVSWEIAKRSAFAAGKSITFGHESLDKMIEWIASSYDLTDQERRLLRPTKMTDISESTASAARWLRDVAGSGVAVVDGKKIVDLFQVAKKSGRVAKTAQTLVTHGMKAAGQVARTGKTVVRANPVILSLQVAYTVGTTGWFAFAASRYNDACFGMLSMKFESDGISTA